MWKSSMRGALALGAASLALCVATQAHAACQVVSATASAGSKEAAIAASRAILEETAADLKRKHGWRSVSVTARTVKGDTFWKAVRPEVPPEAKMPPDVRTARAFTTCWRGVVVPVACTSGGLVCGR